MANPASIFKPTLENRKTIAARAMHRAGLMLGEQIEKITDQIKMTREGFSVQAFDVLIEEGFSRAELGWIIRPRTLRHRQEKQERLTPDESGRLLRAVKIYAMASEVLGSEQAARQWLHKPRRAFDGMSAMELMQTEPGAALVEETLGQIDAGYFA